VTPEELVLHYGNDAQNTSTANLSDVHSSTGLTDFNNNGAKPQLLRKKKTPRKINDDAECSFAIKVKQTILLQLQYTFIIE